MRKILVWMSLAVAFPIAALVVYLAFLQLSGNFHEILPGQLYRSAQPTPQALEAYIRQYGIRTVINLRGPSTSRWYRDEIATTSKLSVQHVDFRMQASHQLTSEDSARLIALLKDAPKPVLIHCKAGADRTGLASVIYLQQVAGVDEEVAEWQLSPLYGHLGLPFLRAYAMDRSWLNIERVLGIES